MRNIEDINSLIVSIESKLRAISDNSEELSNNHGFVVKTFEDLKNEKIIIKHSQVLDDLAKVTSWYLSVFRIETNSRHLKSNLSELSLTPSLVSKYRFRLENIILNCKDLKEPLLALKEMLQSKARFYNSVSFSMETGYKA